MAICWIDLSTGDFYVSSTSVETLVSDLQRIRPTEILVPDDAASVLASLRDFVVHPQQRETFSAAKATSVLHSLKMEHRDQSWREFDKSELSASAAVLNYILLTQRGKMPALTPPKRFKTESTMLIDPSTRKSLELIQTQSGDVKGSLLSVLDTTLTSSGARLLAERLCT
jgi:DNA mismatch repair protein MutS